ncbi:FAST kinase domain-containing protein 2, mitochondrial isoform X2 [Pyrgilauda ruficollis]|uniref:FAST kinase domain-containing protein 2, mitochondrial isoform X2 n=1 Tax=Pyrgilauda ruficollis TaxID=221976 RepID=UPI001B8802F0|nr:FAST kinase domain-containing protein 2, mitochondrial isoform X2 [Pyrgilauda ruficollis]
MNNKISYLLNTVRCVHRYSSVLAPKSSAITRKHVSWIGRYRDPLGNVNFRKLLLNILPSLHGSSLRFASQKTDVYSTGAEALVSEKASQSSLEVEKLDDSGSSKAKHVVDHSDPFFSSLGKCSCPCDALDLAAEAAVSIKHYTNCLTTAWRLFKRLSEEQQRYEKQLIFEHPAFVKLCQQLLREARRMTRGDLVFSLHALVSLGVPQNTLLVQTLLRVCQEKLNQLDNRCISVLATTLAGMDKDKNVTSGAAHFKYQRHLYSAKPDEMPGKRCSSFSEKEIRENVHDVPFRQLILILEACHTLQYRNVKLFSALADYVNSTAYLWDKRQIILFLSACETLGFQPTELLDIFAEKVTEDPDFLNLKNLLIVLQVYSRLNHVPRVQKHLFFETLHSCLNNCLPQISNRELLKAVYSLGILGYLPHRALDELLQKDSKDELILPDDLKEQNTVMLRCVKTCMELDSPSFTKPAFVLTENLSSLVSLNLRKAQEALIELLGDENMFRQNVRLPYRYHIDFEIRMDSDRKKVLPIAATDDHPDSRVHRLAFLFAPVSAFCLGTTHPQGKLAMKKRHLTKLGYHVILIQNKKFQEMKNEDAVEFLKRKIYSEDAFSFPEATVQDNN